MTGPALSTIAKARRLGIELTVCGGSIRYRPLDLMTAELAAAMKDNKPAIIAALSERLPSKARVAASRLIRQARADGDKPLSFRLRDSFRERAAICEFSGNLSRAEAEQMAADEIAGIALQWNAPATIDTTANDPAPDVTSPVAEWLTQALSNGPRTGNHIFEQGKAAGFSQYEIEGAIDAANVTVTVFARPTKDQLRSGIRGNGGLWELRGWQPNEVNHG